VLLQEMLLKQQVSLIHMNSISSVHFKVGQLNPNRIDGKVEVEDKKIFSHEVSLERVLRRE
jgi:hypothetical protein